MTLTRKEYYKKRKKETRKKWELQFKQMVKEGLTISQMAEQTGLSRSGVFYQLKDLGLHKKWKQKRNK